jgi:hypothetical protein
MVIDGNPALLLHHHSQDYDASLKAADSNNGPVMTQKP